MIPENSVWKNLNDSIARGEEAIVETLRPWRAPLVGYLRGWGIGAEKAYVQAGLALSLIAKPSFLESVDPRKIRFRPLMSALARHALKESQPWVTLREDDADPEFLTLEVTDDPEFDRAWLGGLVRAGVERLTREEPSLGEAIVNRYERGGEASPDLREAQSRLRLLLHVAVLEYTTPDEFSKEVQDLQRVSSGSDRLVELGRELLGEGTLNGQPPD